VHLVLIDLIPALLSWEGRDRSSAPDIAPGAEHALEHLYENFHLIGVADAGISSRALGDVLQQEGLSGYFDTVVTSAAHGPALSPRTLRRMIATVGRKQSAAVVTARKSLADSLRSNRLPTVLTSHDEFERVPDALFELAGGRVNP
jgi:hypothetical protein